MMERFVLKIGRSFNVATATDLRRTVAFMGEWLASLRIPDAGKFYEKQTLYKMEDGRFLIYFEAFHASENCSWIRIVSPADLDIGGYYELLGNIAGLSQTLTVDEALKLQKTLPS